jgi:hypothetical protein
VVGVPARQGFSIQRAKGSDRSPYSVVPESPRIGGLVPHHLSPRRPRRSGWLRRCPRRRNSPGAKARRTGLACRTLAVVAVIPVPVVRLTPARIPLIARAPVIAGCGGRGRLGQGAEAASQSERGQRQPANHQHACTPLYRRHLPRISLTPGLTQAFTPLVAQEAVPTPAMLCDQSTGTRG